MIKIENKNDIDQHKSEEVQSIIDRMPTSLTKWLVLCIGILISTILSLGFIIQYPDTVDGEISITGQLAPIRIVANSSSRIHLLMPNKSYVKKGILIAYLENGANYKNILYLENIIKNLDLNNINTFFFSDTLRLGEVSQEYNTFYSYLMDYYRLKESKVNQIKCLSLKQDIESNKKFVLHSKSEYAIRNKIIENSKNQLDMDSILYDLNGLSEKDYKKAYNQHLLLLEAGIQSKNQLDQYLSKILQNNIELQMLSLEEKEELIRSKDAIIRSKNLLLNAITLWKERYLQYATIDGELEYLDFWRENTFIKSGQELFSVIPKNSNLIGEVIIPSKGAGKVKIGQKVNIKLYKYPYDEYGLIEGNVQSISRLTNKSYTEKGNVDVYKAIIKFPIGLLSNFGLIIPFDFETKGIAEIITIRKSLIKRLFDNIKSSSVK